MEGWISLHRQISDNALWTCEKFSRGQAWVDLLLLANHKDSYFYHRGNRVDIKRGQVGWSQLSLSKRWKWSRSKVKKFIEDLEKEQQIEQQKASVLQLITIKNYDRYQEKEQQKDNRKTIEEQQNDTDNNVNNDNNGKLNKNIPPFEDFKSWGVKKLNELGKNPNNYIYALTAKYESWVENGWKDGNDNDIKRWRSKLTNTIPHLSENKTESSINKNGMAF